MLVSTSTTALDLAWIYDLRLRATPLDVVSYNGKQIQPEVANYPNPFNASTSIKYSVSEPQESVLTIYDNLGRMIYTRTEDHSIAGEYEHIWNGTDSNGLGVASGIYHVTVKSGPQSTNKSMILIK